MSTRKRVLMVVSGLVLVWASCSVLLGQEKEDLLFEEIPVVITASRKAQPITESPAAITVITAEDIRFSGAVSIPEVLRMTAGVDVMTITLRDQQVGVRGLNTVQSNKLLVLVDGRSVYTDLYGSVFWDLFPISLREIKRIEVVKSPVSSMYGANAFSGVVNIITRTPEDINGSCLNLTMGENQTWIGSILHGGAGSRWSYKASGTYDSAREWDGSQQAGRNVKANGMLSCKLGRNSNASVSAGWVQTQDRKLFASFGVGTSYFSGCLGYVQFDYKYKNLSFRSSFNQLSFDLTKLPTPDTQAAHTHTAEFELIHSFQWGRTHSVVWGIDYRQNTVEETLLFSQRHHQSLLALFLEDQILLGDSLRITLGGRFDTHPLVADHFSPRGNILFAPGKDHVLRLSITQAYRNPSFVDSYMNFHLQRFIPPHPPFISTPVPFDLFAQGSEDIQSEGVTALELGYQWRGLKGVQLDVNLFYNEYKDFFSSHEDYVYYEADELFPGSPGNMIFKEISTHFANGGDAWGMGGEISLDINFNSNLSAFLNYAYQKITDKDDDLNTLLVNEEGMERAEFPGHKLNAGIRIKMPYGLSFNGLMHYVSKKSHHIFFLDGHEYDLNLRAYVLVNCRLGYVLKKDRVELWLAAFNLFNDMHYEYPPGLDAQSPQSHQLGRRITAGIDIIF